MQMKKFVISSALVLVLCALVISALGCHVSAPPAQNSSESTQPAASSQYVKYVLQGMVFMKEDKYDQAISEFTKAIELDPDNDKYAEVYVSRGICYVEVQEYDKAIDDFTKCIELDPNNANAYGGRGHCYTLKGEIDKAVADFAKATQLNPDLLKEKLGK
jgi:tetratricopeptide (TPR) repeat protein